MSRYLLAVVVLLMVLSGVMVAVPRVASQTPGPGCDDPEDAWLMCEDFEGGGAGWADWFAGSAFTECKGCRDGVNDPARIRLVNEDGAAHSGEWAVHMPAEASANYQGAALTYRDCDGTKRQGCRLNGHEQLYYRTFVRLADDHEYVHHFLSLGGTRTDGYWEGDGNAGCRPNGYRSAGTTVDFNRSRELFFYTYFPEMHCDSGGYCSGAYAQGICDGCARKDMPCSNGPECCWGNHFGPEEPEILERGRWVCLEMTMRLNTPGEDDGEMAFWVDDELAHRQTGMNWRDVPELQLNKAWLQHYVASGDADQSNRVWFDDMVVSTERIGCGPAAVPPTERPTEAPTTVPPTTVPTVRPTPVSTAPATAPPTLPATSPPTSAPTGPPTSSPTSPSTAPPTVQPPPTGGPSSWWLYLPGLWQ